MPLSNVCSWRCWCETAYITTRNRISHQSQRPPTRGFGSWDITVKIHSFVQVPNYRHLCDSIQEVKMDNSNVSDSSHVIFVIVLLISMYIKFLFRHLFVSFWSNFPLFSNFLSTRFFHFCSNNFHVHGYLYTFVFVKVCLQHIFW